MPLPENRCFLSLALLSLVAVLSLAACRGPGDPGNAPPGPTYTGPQYLYNTVGSLTRLSNNEFLPVSGFGLVVDLNGTGSSEVPQYLRQWLINDMTKRGVGLTKFRDVLDASPEQVLADDRTSVVRVRGLIPPGAVAGDRFDLLVEAADTRTTDLAGGRLWEASLAQGGVNPQQAFVEPQAIGRGPIYVDPVNPQTDDKFAIEEARRRAIIVNGGIVEKSRTLELVLNQPSSRLSREVQDKINERFPAEPNARWQTANATSPLVIEVKIPNRYRDQPQLFLDLVQHLYINRDRNFEPLQAQRLAEELVADPAKRNPVVWAWKSLGPRALPVISRYYANPVAKPGEAPPPPLPTELRLAALDAGAFLGDERASEYLLELAGDPDPKVRRTVAESLVNLPSSFRGERALRQLLDDANNSVRIAAYEALARTGDSMIVRTLLLGPKINGRPELKFTIDRVPSDRPLIFISQRDYPRLVIFDPDLGFAAPTVAGVWNNQLMVRQMDPDASAELFYQQPVVKDGRRTVETHTEPIDPTVATFAYVLAHDWRNDPRDTQVGFDLTYGQVVDAVYQLVLSGAIESEVEISRSVLANLIRELDEKPSQPGPERPETGPVPAPGDGPPSAAPDSGGGPLTQRP